MSVLFVAGPGRSGTTAFSSYMNQHPRILICRERYKFLQPEITPDLFDPGRILDYRDGETNISRDYHEKLLSGKDLSQLRWVGDKTPSYVRNMPRLHANNPGARFIVLYRPIEEVAESYEARSKNPKDAWLGGKNGFEIGIRDWNVAMRRTRQFVESRARPEVLVVSYHDFFHRNEACIPLISDFLDLEFDPEVRRSWSNMSRSFEDKRRRKEPLSEEQARLIQSNRDYEAETWVLDRIQKQWDGLGGQPAEPAPPDDGVKEKSAQSGGGGQGLARLRQRVQELEQSLEQERQRTQYLEVRLRGLESRVSFPRGPLYSRLSKLLGRLRSRLPGR